jgi:riboflavin kinase/FMN adenylyltransferase
MFAAEWAAYGRTDLIESGLPLAISIGNFDGVHAGHRHLLTALKSLANGSPTAILTFDPHPSRVFLGDKGDKLLSSVEDRVSGILACRIDLVLVQKFSAEFAELTALEFCEDFLLSNLNLSSVLLGFDFRFGKSRQGNFAFMTAVGQTHEFDVFREEPITHSGVIVSSSEIRQLVAAGQMEKAEALLSRPFSLVGRVVKGDQRGRLLGYPTANLEPLPVELLRPAAGVYAGFLELDENGERLPSVMSFGVRPTFGSSLEYRSECHIFDFSADLYGRKVRLHIKHALRGEEKFSDVEALKTQMALDCVQARKLLCS